VTGVPKDDARPSCGALCAHEQFAKRREELGMPDERRLERSAVAKREG
jgi:hypothetical protein